jgi:energy-coupling factor transport system ATP-binding protein
LLLLDEPTANLDPEGVIEIRDAVRRTLEATHATLVVIEHRIAVWRDIVDRIIVLDAHGGVIADGGVDDVLVRHAAALSAAGVWLPERTGAVRDRIAPGATVLETRGLEVARRNGPAIPIEDAAVREGSAYAVMGRNGSGKSTFALTIGGLLAPRSGSVRATPRLAGSVGDDPLRWSPAQLLTRIGSVFQNPEHQILGSTVRADLAIGPRAIRSNDPELAERVDEVLHRLRLDALAEANPFTLSGGQKRRLSVATAIITRPRVLVLDEPTFGQDALTWQELVDLLADLRDDGHSVIAATHDDDFVRALDAHVLRLSADPVGRPSNHDGVAR